MNGGYAEEWHSPAASASGIPLKCCDLPLQVLDLVLRSLELISQVVNLLLACLLEHLKRVCERKNLALALQQLKCPTGAT
jgi:hypothetical protein